MVEITENNITTKPELLKYWHQIKNSGINPETVQVNSNKKYWWVCEKGHEWQTSANNQNRNRGCPCCSNKKVLIGYNDLATTHPDIAKQWHPTKNGDMKPTDVVAGSDKKAWWVCEHGHEWETAIETRKNGSNCPYCTNQKLLIGYNDLATTHVELSKEWHPTKNGSLKPTDVIAGSGKKVWWRCKHGHEWESKINSRACNNVGCPYCSKNGMSRPEMIVLYYIKKHLKIDALHKYKIQKTEFDIFFIFNDKKYAVEYDGSYFHKNKRESDLKKNLIAHQNDIILYRLREAPLENLNDYSIDFIVDYKQTKEFETAISNLLFEIGQINASIHINDDIAEINSFIEITRREESLYSKFPEIAKEWHPTKNGKLRPEHVAAGSNIRVWWKCERGHEWTAKINNRTVLKRKCPYCTNQKVLVGYNDLASQYPDIAKQWHPIKNGDMKPIDIIAKSNKKAWWQCEHGHEWYIAPSRRIEGCNCPVCANKVVLQGFNDLATTHPHLAKQWHPTKNGNLKPTEVVAGSEKKVWWICEHGHEWETQVFQRKNEYGCPYCANQRLLVGYNDLATTHPELVKEWHPTKNGSLKPTDVIAGSNKKVWWRCDKRHEWDSCISSRANGTNCPICTNRKILIGFNDLATTHPELAQEWHPTKNDGLMPTDVTAGSRKKVWWKCEHGHEWDAAIYSRTKGNGCRHCYRNRKHPK